MHEPHRHRQSQRPRSACLAHRRAHPTADHSPSPHRRAVAASLDATSRRLITLAMRMQSDYGRRLRRSRQAGCSRPTSSTQNSVGDYVYRNAMDVKNWNAAYDSVGNLPITPVTPGISISSTANVVGAVGGFLSTGWNVLTGSDCTTCGDLAMGGSAAAGGFLIYPNKTNNSSLVSVYRK